MMSGLVLCFLTVGDCSIEKYLTAEIVLLGPKQSPEVKAGLLVRLVAVNADQGCISKLVVRDWLVCVCCIGGCMFDLLP